MIATSRRTSSTSIAVLSFRFEIDLHASSCFVSRSVQRYVIPNSPRPSSRPITYLSPMRLRDVTSFRTRIGTPERISSSAYGFGLVFLLFLFLPRFESATSSTLTHALQFPMPPVISPADGNNREGR